MVSPPALKPRMFHMSCSYHIQDQQTDAIVYGGNKRRENKYDRNVTDVVAIFRFGKFKLLFHNESLLLYTIGSIQRLDSICVETIRRDKNLLSNTNKLPIKLQKKVNSSQNKKVLLFYPYNDYFVQDNYNQF